MSVRVEIVNRTLVPICQRNKSQNLIWPDTVPGTEALLECPQHFIGNKVSRLCSMKDATTPEWQTPDFSHCLYKPFTPQYDKVPNYILKVQWYCWGKGVNFPFFVCSLKVLLWGTKTPLDQKQYSPFGKSYGHVDCHSILAKGIVY